MHKSMKVVKSVVEAYEGNLDDKHDLMKSIMQADELQGRIQDLLRYGSYVCLSVASELGTAR